MQSLSDLTEDQVVRLSDELDRYLQSLESGAPLDPEDVARRHPDIAFAFTNYLKKLDAIYDIRTALPPSPINPDATPESVLQLGDFRLEAEIGRGGMGIVYKAQQLSLNRQVAVKILPMAAMLDARQIARFKNEAHIAGLLRHPHIVPIYSIGYENGLHYFAMQLIQGLSLEQWIRSQQAVAPESTTTNASFPDKVPNARHDWKTTVAWIIDVAEALQAAHEAGILHRDIKPSNLLLDREGKIWVTDFGLARGQNPSALTRSGDLVGTLRYMSPEQTTGSSALQDGRTDVYSLGATLYEMLALQPAIAGEDGPHLLRVIQENDIPPLDRVTTGLPRDLSTVVAKSMAGKRDDRYETASEFADDLRRVLAGEPTCARPATAIDLATRWAVKHRRYVAILSIACLISLIGFASNTARLATAKLASDLHAQRASMNEKLARDVVHRLGAQMAEQLADIPAASGVRHRLLAETLDYYRRFATEAERDPNLQEDLAITLGKIGGVLNAIGQRAEAIDALSQSATMYASMVHKQATPHLLQSWSTSQNNLAQVLQQAGEIERAAGLYASAVRTQKQLCQAGQQSARSPLATSLNNLALLLNETGHMARSEQLFKEAIDCLSAEPSSLEEHRTQLADLKTNYSQLLSDRSPREAIELAQQALSLRLGIMSSSTPHTLGHDLDLASHQSPLVSPQLASQTISTLHALGTAHLSAADYESACSAFQQAVTIGQQLTNRWPDQFSFQRDLAISNNHLGLASCHAEAFDRANSAFLTAMKLGTQLRDRFPQEAELQSLLGGVLNNLGYLHQQQGDAREAARFYRQAVAAQSAAVQLAPQVVRYRDFLKKHQENARTVHDQPSSIRKIAPT